ncbi:MAG TPA: hypothetical protein VK123_02440 [Candidatus Limnocylindrales bacterium]|nr:hypothetical protein [Candidatus Limnocylindrales bacterium]
MLPVLAVAAGLTSFALAPGADTTLAVPQGMDLNVANYAGEVFIEGWDRNALRIRTDHSDEDKVVVFPGHGAVVVKAYSKKEDDQSADLRLIVPLWMNVSISGIHTDVIVTGTQGQVKVDTVHGDVIVRGGRRLIDLSTVNDDICVSDASGTVRAETVNGDAYVWRTDSDSVDVSTVNGDVVYEGSMDDRGVYRFASHNGDIDVAMPRAVSAAVLVSTFSGDFQSNFPVTLTGTNDPKRFQFCVGSCSARVELSSFQGTIQIYRAADMPSLRVQRMDGIVDRIIEKRLDRKIDRATRIVNKMKERFQKRHDGSDGSDGDGE